MKLPRRAASSLAAASLALFVVAAHAEDEAPVTSGIEREASIPGDVWEDVGSAALFLPRETLSLMFMGTSMAAAVLQDESTVPRFGNVSSGDTRLYVFPTAFVETESTLSIGARMIGASDHVATSFRAGVGGPDDTVVEGRVFLRTPTAFPMVVGFETFFSRASALAFPGLGQDPEDDARNRFRAERRGDSAYYDESRSRGIFSVGMRPTEDIEILPSISLDRRSLEGTGSATAPSIDTVFVSGAPFGAVDRVRVWYAELALRLDTRSSRGGPQEGLVLETYGGLEQNMPNSPDVSMVRVGGTAMALVQVLRRSNVIIPRLSLDAAAALGEEEIPFVELPRQPTFRGAGDRFDLVSMVGAVDYRWGFASNVGMRLFLDTATVGPSVQDLDFAHFRWAVGAGLDLWSTGSDLGSFSVAGGPDGVNFHLSFGVESGFGDRQHRD